MYLPRVRRRIGARVMAVRRPAGVIALCLALGVAGVLVGLRLATPGEYPTDLGRVSLRISPSTHGAVEAYVPLADWGVRVHPFSAPLKLHVEARTVDRDQVLRAASGDRTLVAGAQRDLENAVRRAVLRTVRYALVTALVFGAILGLALFAGGVRSRPALLGAPALVVVVAAALTGAAVWRAHATLRADALDHPTFYARGAELVQLLDAAEHARQAGDAYTTKVEGAVRGFAALLSQPFAGAVRDARPALLVSDLHGNRFALDSLRAYARDKPVFFAGDFGNTGSRAEADALAGRVAGLGKRVIAISGNHDSSIFMRALARRGVTVLTRRGVLGEDGRPGAQQTVMVGDMRVAGFDDPLEWHGDDPANPRRIFSFTEQPDPAQATRAAEREVQDWFDRLPERPDVVMVHQNGLAQFLARSLHAAGYAHPLTILTGHDHRQHVTSYGDITVVDAGTVGASGLYGVGHDSVGLADMHLSAGLLQAVDLIAVEPVSGSAQARRVVISPCAAVCERTASSVEADAGGTPAHSD